MSDLVVIITFHDRTITKDDISFEGFEVVDGVEWLIDGQPVDSRRLYFFRGMATAAARMDRERVSDLLGALGLERSLVLDNRDVPIDVPGIADITIEPYEVETEEDVARRESLLALDDERDDVPPPNDDAPNLRAINARAANVKKLDKPGEGQLIGIMDTGIAEHAHLKVYHRVSFVEGDRHPELDDSGHGTKCAGIAAGAKGGVAPYASLVSIKVSSGQRAPAYAILAGLCWAMWNKIDVVSISLAGRSTIVHIPAYSNALHALTAQGCVVVVAAGGANRTIQFPANTPGAIAVGLWQNGSGPVPKQSNWGGKGNQILLVAPFTGIATTSRVGDKYVLFTGSSATAPHVAGAVALFKQRFPKVSPQATIGALIMSARPLAPSRQYDAISGAGLLDCDKLLNAYLRIRSGDSESRPSSPSEDRLSKINRTDADHVRPGGDIHVRVLLGDEAKDEPGQIRVTIVNIDSYHIESGLVWPNQWYTFWHVPFGRYCVIAVKGDDYSGAESVVVVNEDGGESWCTLDLDSQSIGRITAFVRVNGVGRSNAIVTVQSGDGFHRSLLTNYAGIAEFNDVIDGRIYRVEACVDQNSCKESDVIGGNDVVFDFIEF